jgi:fused signal recognition particle receptor
LSETPWFERLTAGFRKTSDRLGENLTGLFTKAALDEATLDEIEEALIASDLGPATAAKVRARLAEERFERGLSEAGVREIVAEELAKILAPVATPLEIDAFPRPQVILVVGVNGSGKTTTIAKLAHLFLEQDYGVLLAAGDTFRAAAIEQLGVWADRAGAEIVQQQAGADPGAVVFDAVTAARSRKSDVVIIDTAGRLHSQSHLMDELKKVRRVIQRVEPSAPHEVLLVLDANQGQNALTQAVQFNEAVGVTGLVLTKLDGTAKGGIVIAIARKLKLPIRFIGVGEQAEDFGEFDARAFASALVSGNSLGAS